MNGVSRALIVGAALLTLPTLGMTQESGKTTKSELSYTYLQVDYDSHDFDPPGPPDSINGDGFTFSGAFQLKNNWHVYGAYGKENLDFGIDLDTWTIGLGYSYSVKENVDLYGRVLYIDASADYGANTVHDDGLGLQFRVRSRVNDKLEIEGGIQYLDLENSDTSLQGSVRYYFTRSFSAGLGVTIGGDFEGLGINARYSF